MNNIYKNCTAEHCCLLHKRVSSVCKHFNTIVINYDLPLGQCYYTLPPTLKTPSILLFIMCCCIRTICSVYNNTME